MMVKAGILHKYGEVLAEFPVVVEAGGAWTSVTPGSQQYWLQAFNNVMYGRWEKIDAGFGRAVLGYFGKTPLPPDQAVIGKASEQLKLAPFDGDPLEAAPKNIGIAKKALEERKIPETDRNVFLVVASIVPGKKMEVNEGIRLLTGKVKIRTFIVTVEPIGAATSGGQSPSSGTATVEQGTPVFSTFAGTVEVVDILVKVGDAVKKGQVLAAVEAMKAKHDIKSPRDGTVRGVHVKVGDEVDSSNVLVTLA
jgi:pyruvate carboxylase subunit B